MCKFITHLTLFTNVNLTFNQCKFAATRNALNYTASLYMILLLTLLGVYILILNQCFFSSGGDRNNYTKLLLTWEFVNIKLLFDLIIRTWGDMSLPSDYFDTCRKNFKTLYENMGKISIQKSKICIDVTVLNETLVHYRTFNT